MPTWELRLESPWICCLRKVWELCYLVKIFCCIVVVCWVITSSVGGLNGCWIMQLIADIRIEMISWLFIFCQLISQSKTNMLLLAYQMRCSDADCWLFSDLLPGDLINQIYKIADVVNLLPIHVCSHCSFPFSEWIIWISAASVILFRCSVNPVIPKCSSALQKWYNI